MAPLFLLAALASGTVTELPPGTEPVPLIVLLHGDGETASGMAAAWGPSAKKRGVAVAALQCPKGEGCAAQSWWKWNGNPSWLVDQTREIAERRPIDTDRMWLVGWSGGGSYIGFRTQELERSFAALVVHGGGIPPALATCPDVRAPVYFLVGDGNPLHYLAVRLREHYDRCGNEVVWTLLPGASHEDERRALPRYREAILDWLSTKRLARRAPEPEGGATSVLATAPATAPSAPASTSSVVPAPASCRCEVPHAAPRSGGAASAIFLALSLARRYRRKGTPSRDIPNPYAGRAAAVLLKARPRVAAAARAAPISVIPLATGPAPAVAESTCLVLVETHRANRARKAGIVLKSSGTSRKGPQACPYPCGLKPSTR